MQPRQRLTYVQHKDLHQQYHHRHSIYLVHLRDYISIPIIHIHPPRLQASHIRIPRVDKSLTFKEDNSDDNATIDIYTPNNQSCVAPAEVPRMAHGQPPSSLTVSTYRILNTVHVSIVIQPPGHPVTYEQDKYNQDHWGHQIYFIVTKERHHSVLIYPLTHVT